MALISILIASYGDPRWEELALEHAFPSAKSQGCEVLVGHDPEGTRHGVRNALAENASGTWLCFLDADDDLLPGYAVAMVDAIDQLGLGHYLLTPSVSYAAPGARKHDPILLPIRGIKSGNCLVLGTLVERSLFLELGGFHDWNARTGNEFDDWDLWIRCLAAGAEIVQVPDAVYVHRQSPESLNRNASRRTALGWQYEIGRKHFPHRYPENWIEQQLKRDEAWARRSA